MDGRHNNRCPSGTGGLGKPLRHAEIVAAASASLVGLDPFEYLNERDPFRRAVMEMIMNAAMKIERDRDHQRANMIANEVGQMLKAAFGK
jgi:hypothetical protein